MEKVKKLRSFGAITGVILFLIGICAAAVLFSEARSLPAILALAACALLGTQSIVLFRAQAELFALALSERAPRGYSFPPRSDSGLPAEMPGRSIAEGCCPVCGAPIREDEPFCSECGIPL